MQNLFGMNRMAPRLALLLLLTLLPTALLGARAQTDDRSASTSPLQQALQVARDLMEEELGRPMNLVRWRFYEDNWGSAESFHLYGSYGIDNCTDSVPVMQKRSKLLFGYTFSIQDVSGRELQARVSYNLVDAVLCDVVIVPPAFGGPTSAAEAAAPEAETAAPAPVAGAGNIEGFALGGQVIRLDANTETNMKSAGMTWVKSQFRYGSSGGVDTARAWIADAHNRGFKQLLSVAGDKNRLVPAQFDAYVNEYAAFLGELAAAGADAIEVWNEPNLDHEWPTGHISGVRYTEMLARAYNAIKAANGGTLVISAAPAPTGAEGAFPGAVVNDDNFMRQMAQAGAAQYMDCLGLHYNEGILSPNQQTGDPRASYPTRYFGSMLERGAQFFPGKSICWTELGYLSGEGFGTPIPASFSWASNVTVAQQAEWLAQAAALSAQDPRVSMMIVWNVNYDLWGADPQAGYAIIRPDGSCPACAALGQVMRGG